MLNGHNVLTRVLVREKSVREDVRTEAEVSVKYPQAKECGSD